MSSINNILYKPLYNLKKNLSPMKKELNQINFDTYLYLTISFIYRGKGFNSHRPGIVNHTEIVSLYPTVGYELYTVVPERIEKD